MRSTRCAWAMRQDSGWLKAEGGVGRKIKSKIGVRRGGRLDTWVGLNYKRAQESK